MRMLPNGTQKSGVPPESYDGTDGLEYCQQEREWSHRNVRTAAATFNEGDASFALRGTTLPPPSFGHRDWLGKEVRAARPASHGGPKPDHTCGGAEFCPSIPDDR